MRAVGALPQRVRARPVPCSAAMLQYHQESSVHRALMWVYALLPTLSQYGRWLPSLTEDLCDIIARETDTGDPKALAPAVGGLVALSVATDHSGNKRRLLATLPYLLQVGISNKQGVTAYFVRHELHDILHFVRCGERRDCWMAVKHYYAKCAGGYAGFREECLWRYGYRIRKSSSEVALWRSALEQASRKNTSVVTRLYRRVPWHHTQSTLT